ncbi:Integrator complex subunit 2 [Quaeritorhiza haematococci]|nr:Integrator complex subunit 2 [Quaeritorhiza haematococci]
MTTVLAVGGAGGQNAKTVKGIYALLENGDVPHESLLRRVEAAAGYYDADYSLAKAFMDGSISKVKSDPESETLSPASQFSNASVADKIRYQLQNISITGTIQKTVIFNLECLVLSQLPNLSSAAASLLGFSASSQTQGKGPIDLFETPAFLFDVSCILSFTAERAPDVISIKSLVQALLASPLRHHYIARIVANAPFEFEEAVDGLIRCYRNTETAKSLLSSALMTLCDLAPHRAAYIRKRLADQNMLPHVQIALARRAGMDMIAVLNALFAPSGTATLMEDATHVKAALSELQPTLFKELSGAGVGENGNQPTLTKGELCARLRVLCGMAGLFRMQFSVEQMRICFDVVKSLSGDRVARLSLCFLLICADQLYHYSQSTPPPAPQLYDTFVRCLSDILQSEHSEMSLMLGVYFHTNQLLEVEKIVRNTLDMEIKIPRDGLFQMRTIFNRNLFNDVVLARRALQLKPTRAFGQELLRGKIFHKVGAAVAENNGRRASGIEGNLSVRDWMYRQICEASIPLHPLMPDLIKVYVESILETPPHSRTITKIPSSDILRVFSSQFSPSSSYRIANSGSTAVTKKITPAQVLMLFYVLYYNEAVFNKIKAGATTPTEGGVPGSRVITERGVAYEDAEYPDELTDMIPIKRILKHAEKADDGRSYRTLYPQLFALACGQFPHLFDPVTFLIEEGRGRWTNNIVPTYFHYMDLTTYIKTLPQPSATTTSSPTSSTSGELSSMKMTDVPKVAPDELVPLLALSSPSTPTSNGRGGLTGAAGSNTDAKDAAKKALCALRYLTSLKPIDLLPYFDCILSAMLPNILHPRTNIEVLNLFRELWDALNAITPREVWLKTTNRLKNADGQRVGREYTQNDLIMDPLLMFKSDPRVFRCPTVYQIFLRILGCYMVASRHRIGRKFQSELAHDPSSSIRESTLNAFISAQDTAIMQMLLEICLETDDDRAGGEDAAFFLHQLFVDNFKYIKLLHFQGYPHELLEMTVSLIPSLHVCFDFIPELLAQPHLAKQVFAIRLAAHLFEQYPISKSLAIAKDVVVPKIRSMAGAVISYNQTAQGMLQAKEQKEQQEGSVGGEAGAVTPTGGLVGTGRHSMSRTKLPDSLPPPPASLAQETWLLNVVPASLQICRAFPSLVDLVVALLNDIKPPIAASKLTRHFSATLYSTPLDPKATATTNGAAVMDPRSACEFLERLEEVVMLTFGDITTQVKGKNQDELNKSIL